MNGHAPAPDYADRLEKFRASDRERDALFSQILKDYENLKIRFDEKEDDWRNEVASRRMWQSKASSCEQNLEKALLEQKQTNGSNNFVLVLIDGDGAIFKDYLYAMGRDGGAEAAHQLHTEIQSQLRSTYPDAPIDDWSIVVQVVLNIQGLATKLQSCGIITNPTELFAFGRAFGLAQPMFSFVDVGGGKERADHKIRETLRLYLKVGQCKHVFFGPCQDNGYLVVLESYRREHAKRLTLLETRPAEPGFVELGLKRISLPGVFRSDNLPAGHVRTVTQVVSPQPTPARTPSVSQVTAPPLVPKSSSPAPSVDSTNSANNSSSWATVGKGAGSKSISIAPKKAAAARRYILLNVHDERLDPDLPASDPGAEARFAERLKTSGKLCNAHYLMGKCPAGEYCDYRHNDKISPGELLVLKHKARSRSCPKKYFCQDFNCTFGHVCKNGNSCWFDPCYFADTHGMDTEVAKRRFEDGTEEWSSTYLNKVRA